MATPDLILIRHAPADTAGRLCGRTDVPVLAPIPALDRLRGMLADVERVVASPARRCTETARALWPGGAAETDARLVEQDFGAWDGLPLAEIPDLGPLEAEDLARHRPPDGESFADLCARVRPALVEIAGGGRAAAIVAHAGTVRAGLALALSSPGAALCFDVAPLSVTRLRVLPGGGVSVICTNCPAG